MNVEDLTKIMDDLKNRFASRFIFSFVVAWLIYNWQITISLFWYDKTQFQAEGYKSIFEFINNQLTINSNNCKTFITAISYTFGLPISKGIINIWDEIIFDFRNWTKTKLVRSQDAKTIINLEKKLSSVSDNTFLNGEWDCSIISQGNDLAPSKKFQVLILNGKWYELVNDKRELKYYIINFYLDPKNSNLLFTRNLVSNEYKPIRELIIFNNVFNSENILEGILGDNYNIKLIKILDPKK